MRAIIAQRFTYMIEKLFHKEGTEDIAVTPNASFKALLIST
ncbi:hypothetical protein JOC94_004156 [Bacillus thermophilus]|uniref:Uncharacterized protein n=1 Tax=Siminovitchia thermophila TaxID=1245522 RepID=A0ABS2RBU7_9BACI|nr:hypothetical protein [Siminovitchia thermophila]MBM7717131.1 hypothetical protein [Siminovitchia thermophila]